MLSDSNTFVSGDCACSPVGQGKGGPSAAARNFHRLGTAARLQVACKRFGGKISRNSFFRLRPPDDLYPLQNAGEMRDAGFTRASHQRVRWKGDL